MIAADLDVDLTTVQQVRRQFVQERLTATLVRKRPDRVNAHLLDAKYFALLRTGGIPDVEQEPVAAVGD